jgi:hypothetical protein
VTSSTEHPLIAFGPVGAVLLRTLAAGRLSPSYLFEGTDRETLHEAGRAFAAGVLAGSPPRDLDARTMRLALAGTHPDLHEQAKDKATVISVAALGALLERVHSTPLEGRGQVFLIDPAEAMEPAGIARYLKALEEPPEATVFVLVTTRAERLPDTVLSRCRRVRFPPLEEDALAARLVAEGTEPQAARAAARAAGGSLGRARRIGGHGLRELADTLVEAACAPAPGVARAAEEARAQLEQAAAERAATKAGGSDSKREQVRVLLRDLLRVLVVEARERAAARESALPERVDAESALDLIARWGRLEAAVAANVTPAAVLVDALAALRREATIGAP